jgi:hypothetical protein
MKLDAITISWEGSTVPDVEFTVCFDIVALTFISWG